MKKYSIIYADPPWAYRTYSKKGQGRSAESQGLRSVPLDHVPVPL